MKSTTMNLAIYLPVFFILDYIVGLLHNSLIDCFLCSENSRLIVLQPVPKYLTYQSIT